MRDYVRKEHCGLILDKGSVLYKPVASMFGNIIINTFLVNHSLPLTAQLGIYYGKISWNKIGINSVLLQKVLL